MQGRNLTCNIQFVILPVYNSSNLLSSLVGQTHCAYMSIFCFIIVN